MNTEIRSGNTGSTQQKPSVFMSYAHQDGTNITRRIVRMLEPYCSEVFWDRKLRAGDWQNQLDGRIQSHDFFLVVMSPAQANSKVCQWELQQAQRRFEQHSKSSFGIVPIKYFVGYKDDGLEKLQYADFSDDFERGFGDLAYIMFAVRRSSWEYLASQPPQELLLGIERGYVPSLIVFECCERLVFEKVWNHLKRVLREAQPHLLIGNPRLPEEVLAQVNVLIPQVAKRLDGINIHRLGKAKELLQTYLECKVKVAETDHESAGYCAINLVADVRRFLTLDAAAKLDAVELANINTNYDSDIAGIFRQSIEVHARAMRLMY